MEIKSLRFYLDVRCRQQFTVTLFWLNHLGRYHMKQADINNKEFLYAHLRIKKIGMKYLLNTDIHIMSYDKSICCISWNEHVTYYISSDRTFFMLSFFLWYIDWCSGTVHKVILIEATLSSEMLFFFDKWIKKIQQQKHFLKNFLKQDYLLKLLFHSLFNNT